MELIVKLLATSLYANVIFVPATNNAATRSSITSSVIVELIVIVPPASLYTTAIPAPAVIAAPIISSTDSSRSVTCKAVIAIGAVVIVVTLPFTSTSRITESTADP